jgi:hypothetical protein
MVDVSGAVLARALCQRQRGHECCTNLQPATARTVRPSPEIRESITTPNLLGPKCRNLATRHVGSLLSFRRVLCGFGPFLAKPLETGLNIRGPIV